MRYCICTVVGVGLGAVWLVYGRHHRSVGCIDGKRNIIDLCETYIKQGVHSGLGRWNWPQSICSSSSLGICLEQTV